MGKEARRVRLGGLRPDFRTRDNRGRLRPLQNGWQYQKLFEALDAPAEKISPLRTLQDGVALVIEVDHLAEVQRLRHNSVILGGMFFTRYLFDFVGTSPGTRLRTTLVGPTICGV